MNRQPRRSRQTGFGLVEVMVAVTLGLIVLAGVVVIFTAQRQVYRNASSQALIQNADSTIAAVITPTVRGAGFLGCSSMNSAGSYTYVGSPATPLSYSTSSAVQGYKASTMPTQIVTGTANDTKGTDWSPTLDSSLTTNGVAQGSDVLVLIGAKPGAQPIGVTAFNSGSLSVNNASALPSASTANPLLLSVSDCGKSAVFLATAISTSANTVTFTSGPNGTPTFANSSQLIPLQQTVYFIAKGDGGESALFQGTMSGPAASAAWTMNEMVPGVSNMQVRYGIGSNGQATQYVDASAVSSNGGWGAVTSIQLGFLIEGNLNSATIPSAATKYTLFNTTLTVPPDSRLRHTYFLTINTRNATL